MKRVLALLLCAALFMSFVGCEVKSGQKTFENIPFESATLQLVAQNGDDKTLENNYYFFTSVDELEKGLALLETEFKVHEISDRETQSLTEFCAQYDEAFFKTHVLLFLKRFHITDSVLSFTQLKAENNQFTLTAQLPQTKQDFSAYRAYFVAFDRQYLLSGQAALTVETTDTMPETQAYENTLVISYGGRCRTVEDAALAEALTREIKSLPLTPSDYDPDAYTFTQSDLSVVGPDVYAVFTADYIAIGLDVYEPNAAATEKIKAAFETYPGPIQTVELPTKPQSAEN